MILKTQHFVIFITLILGLSCNRKEQRLSSIRAEQIAIKDSLPETDTILEFITPYKKRIDYILDSTLAFAAKTISKDDGLLNTTAGNLLADIVLSEANPIFKTRTGKNIDFVLLNHGGIRSIISKGHVSARTAYEIMPFENTVVVVELTGKSVRELTSFLIQSGRPHPIAGIQILLDKNNGLESITIQGEPFDENRNYYVATSNYLVTGGDDMGFFAEKVSVVETDYLIRNTIIDYFKKVDTIAPTVDDRFMKLK
ncbi:5'-nucleotidase C-terminal domain-containing protein [Costertonia aggregata]|uniref:5'-nucleotidase C-terminal domain-containing protein n=1 Tax=Costertonia aggregata TaxID=343403 RepID=A0A7H9AKI4_9FLAO|nr:5'-nucleotidase C-terminal domain-containing protein [Costertonia aggregata]QLG43853.1 5'-nucleotidase C-terminal domain-containing protein [Costertonia aggregata]